MSNHPTTERGFVPRASKEVGGDAGNGEENMNTFSMFHPDDMDFNLMDGMYDDEMGQDLFDSRPDSFSMDSNAFSQTPRISNDFGTGSLQATIRIQGDHGFTGPVKAFPPSAQSDIISKRKHQVSQLYGQITPPEETGRASKMEQHEEEEDNGKLTREQRARVAANTRHSNSKKPRKDSTTDAVQEGLVAGTAAGKNVVAQREKNRVAAAKCRAKKKAGNEERAEQHRDQAAKNNFLVREQRELRNEKTRLQNMILAHRPGVCDCHDIHSYNTLQAQRLLLEAEVQGGRPISSPSQDSVSSGNTIRSDFQGGSRTSASRSIMTPGGMSMPPRRQSFGRPMNYSFGIADTSEHMQMASPAAYEPQQIPQDFADFLQSSPGGRAGFS